MKTWLRFTILSVVIAGAAVVAAIQIVGGREARLEKQVNALEKERAQLVDYVDRLSATTRVAQVDVLKQTVEDGGCTLTTLLWREIGTDGTLGAPIVLEISGKTAYFEALVLKFARNLVEEADPARGVTLATFRRIFGDQQAPESGPGLDSAHPPESGPQVARDVRARLWSKFWNLVDDPRLAEQYGVRVAQIEAPAVPLRAGQIWEVTLDAAGGVNLRKLADKAR